jgi:hypothetical protein
MIFLVWFFNQLDWVLTGKKHPPCYNQYGGFDRCCVLLQLNGILRVTACLEAPIELKRGILFAALWQEVVSYCVMTHTNRHIDLGNAPFVLAWTEFNNGSMCFPWHGAGVKRNIFELLPVVPFLLQCQIQQCCVMVRMFEYFVLVFASKLACNSVPVWFEKNESKCFSMVDAYAIMLGFQCEK